MSDKIIELNEKQQEQVNGGVRPDSSKPVIELPGVVSPSTP